MREECWRSARGAVNGARPCRDGAVAGGQADAAVRQADNGLLRLQREGNPEGQFRPVKTGEGNRRPERQVQVGKGE